MIKWKKAFGPRLRMTTQSTLVKFLGARGYLGFWGKAFAMWFWNLILNYPKPSVKFSICLCSTRIYCPLQLEIRKSDSVLSWVCNSLYKLEEVRAQFIVELRIKLTMQCQQLGIFRDLERVWSLSEEKVVSQEKKHKVSVKSFNLIPLCPFIPLMFIYLLSVLWFSSPKFLLYPNSSFYWLTM